MKLSRREKQILLEACERIEAFSFYPSCSAIFTSCGDTVFIKKYCRFYGKRYGTYWIYQSKFYDEMRNENLISEWRQTLLLFFREAASAVD